MSGRPALIRTRDVKAILKAARLEGAREVTVKVDKASVVIPLVPNDKPDGPEGGGVDL